MNIPSECWVKAGLVGLSLFSGIEAASAATAGTPTPYGPAITVNSYPSQPAMRAEQGYSVAKRADGSFLAAWSVLDTSNAENGTTRCGIYGRLYAADSTALGEPFQIASSSVYAGVANYACWLNKAVADSQGNFEILWGTHGQAFGEALYLHTVSAAGEPVGGDIRIDSDQFPSIDYLGADIGLADNGNFVVTWRAGDPSAVSGSNRIVVERFSAGGAPRDAEPVVVATSTRQAVGTSTYTGVLNEGPAIAVNRTTGDFVVSWVSTKYRSAAFWSSLSGGVRAQRYGDDGQVRGSPINVYSTFRVTTGPSSLVDVTSPPALAMGDDGSFFVVWSTMKKYSAVGLYAKRYSDTGKALTGKSTISTPTLLGTGSFLGNSWSGSYPVALDSAGNLVVGWLAYADSTNDQQLLLTQRLSAQGSLIGDTVNVAGPQYFYNLAIAADANARFLAAWAAGPEAFNSASASLYGQQFDEPNP